MTVINTYALAHNNVLSVYSDKDRIELDPEYQRQGEVWSIEKKQLLIDSIINRYDIPKLYFHKLDFEAAKKKKIDYTVVDGRQRLEAIFGFIDGEFSLSQDFEYLEDPSVRAAKLTYSDLAKKFPKLKQRFDAFTLPIICVETREIDLIEDMFSRLNEAVPLNAAEKRNAIGGDMARAFRDLATHKFFTQKLRFSDTRYRHREVAARLLFLEQCLRHEKLIDTKKPFLDQFAREYKSGKKKAVVEFTAEATKILDVMRPFFTSKDILLAAQSAIPIFYIVFRSSIIAGTVAKISRAKLDAFHAQRQANRTKAEQDITKADFELLEYDRLSQQGTNDASSIRERVRILTKFLGV
jgi:Protein of unknown function DUF262